LGGRAAFAFAPGDAAMRKTIPETMFAGKDSVRLTLLQDWVLQHAVTEIEMNERQFWNFVSAQPLAEKPWTTYMGRMLHVSDMPTESQKCLGLFDKRTPGTI
jgi:hypothetical protein